MGFSSLPATYITFLCQADKLRAFGFSVSSLFESGDVTLRRQRNWLDNGESGTAVKPDAQFEKNRQLSRVSMFYFLSLALNGPFVDGDYRYQVTVSSVYRL